MSEHVSKQRKALAKFAEGVKQLDEVLAGLSESGYDFSREQGKWTIRQIIHHIVDVEDVWKICIKAGLGNPGCTIDMNWYIVDNKCAEPLDYAHRPITDDVELFRAIRHHLVELVNHLPGAWDRYFTTIWGNLPEGKTFKVGDIICFKNAHMEGHVKQIIKTREKHGV